MRCKKWHILFTIGFRSVSHAISYEALGTVLCVITDITLHTLQILNPVVMYPKRRKHVFSTNCKTYMWSIIEIFYKYDKQVVALHSCWLPGDVGRQGIGSNVCFSYPGIFRFQHHHYITYLWHAGITRHVSDLLYLADVTLISKRLESETNQC